MSDGLLVGCVLGKFLDYLTFRLICREENGWLVGWTMAGLPVDWLILLSNCFMKNCETFQFSRSAMMIMLFRCLSFQSDCQDGHYHRSLSKENINWKDACVCLSFVCGCACMC